MQMNLASFWLLYVNDLNSCWNLNILILFLQLRGADKSSGESRRQGQAVAICSEIHRQNDDELLSLEATIRDELLSQEPFDIYPSDADDAFEREARMNRQLFVGKRDSNPLGKRTAPILGFKRFSPREELKRSTILVPEDISEFDMNKRGNLPMFVGKRRAPCGGERRQYEQPKTCGETRNASLCWAAAGGYRRQTYLL